MASPRLTILSQLDKLLSDSHGIRAFVPPDYIDLSSRPGGELSPVVIRQKIDTETGEKTGTAGYTAIHLYVDKLVNNQKEKFASFSGYAIAVIEIRATHDRSDHLETVTNVYLDAIVEVLRIRSGNLNGCYFSGGYEVEFGAVKKGGRHFQQITKVKIRVEIRQA